MPDPNYTTISNKGAIARRLGLPPSVSDDVLFGIISNALDVAEMINMAVHEAANEGEAITDIGVDSSLAMASAAVFARTPGELAYSSIAAEQDLLASTERALGRAFNEKLQFASRTVPSSKFVGWVRACAQEQMQQQVRPSSKQRASAEQQG